MSRRQTKYNSVCEKDHLWLQKCKNDQFSAYCNICTKTFSLSGGGVCVVKQHEKIKNHISRTEELCNKLIFQKGSDSVVELDKSIQFSDIEKTIRADVFQALKYADGNWSFQSANDKGK